MHRKYHPRQVMTPWVILCTITLLPCTPNYADNNGVTSAVSTEPSVMDLTASGVQGRRVDSHSEMIRRQPRYEGRRELLEKKRSLSAVSTS